MAKGVAITGMGIISALGPDVPTHFNALKNARHGLSYPEILKTRHTNLPVGEIKHSNADLAEKLNIPQELVVTRAALLAALAIKEALNQSKIRANGTFLVSGTSVGGMDATEEHFKNFQENKELRKYIRAQHPGFSTEQLAEYFGITGGVNTISTACSSGANAIMLGAKLIKSGKAKRVIAGGTDCLSRFTLNGFNSLMILDKGFCKPFDKNRNGLNLGEGAAYLVLEAEGEIGERLVLGRLSGYGNANDAFHQTASSETGEGAFLSMQKALKTAEISAEKIDYINAHGTGTLNNDLSESAALKRIFKSEIPDFSSTKAYSGHTLAAAGALEAVFSLLSLQEKCVFPNLNFKKGILEVGLYPETGFKKKDINFVMSNSFGFGGNCTSLIFSRNGE